MGTAALPVSQGPPEWRIPVVTTEGARTYLITDMGTPDPLDDITFPIHGWLASDHGVDSDTPGTAHFSDVTLAPGAWLMLDPDNAQNLVVDLTMLGDATVVAYGDNGQEACIGALDGGGHTLTKYGENMIRLAGPVTNLDTFIVDGQMGTALYPDSADTSEYRGDRNYDGVVDFNDYNLIDNTFLAHALEPLSGGQDWPPRGAEGCQAPFQTDEEVPDNGEKAPATARRSESRKGRSERGGLFCGARPATKAGIAGAGEAIARRRSRTSWRSSSPSPTMSRFGTADTAIASRSAWPRPWAWIITPRQKKASRRKKS